MKGAIQVFRRGIFWILVLFVGSSQFSWALAEEDIHFNQIPQINSIVLDPADPEGFLIATYYGVFAIAADGKAERIAPNAGALLDLVRHPDQPFRLLSSGFRSETEKLGVIRSDDGGRTWAQVAEGAGGPVAFHALAIGRGGPAVLYGVNEGLQVSRDGGRSWSKVGPTPGQVFDIAVSGRDPATLYLAGHRGLFRSSDGGRTWSAAYQGTRPATMVQVTEQGTVYAFIYGLGLISSPDVEAMSWSTVATAFADRAMMDLAVDPARPGRMLGVVDTGAVMLSRDYGKTWRSFEGQQYATPQRIAAGRGRYEENCAGCHGAKGVGERPEDIYARDENGLPVAPPMDDSAHAWHHSDAQLIETILQGSPRNERMAAWKEYGISPEYAKDLVAYIKSLWNFRSLACQGPRHMACMR